MHVVADPGVALQRVQHRRVQGHLPGLAELGFPDHHGLGPVDVAAVEGDGFPDAHPGGRQQSDHGLKVAARNEVRRPGAPVISVSMSSGLKMNGS